MASTSVVLPWSTCATIATLRRSARPVTGSGRSGAVTDTQELQPRDGCGSSRLRGVIPPTGGDRGVPHHVVAVGSLSVHDWTGRGARRPGRLIVVSGRHLGR